MYCVLYCRAPQHAAPITHEYEIGEHPLGFELRIYDRGDLRFSHVHATRELRATRAYLQAGQSTCMTAAESTIARGPVPPARGPERLRSPFRLLAVDVKLLNSVELVAVL